MFLFGFVLVGILIGVAMNLHSGNKDYFYGISALRALWLPVAGLLLESTFTYFPAFAVRFAGLITCAGYLCIFTFLLLNRRNRRSVLLMALGSLSNFIVIACNGFRMPISPAALAMYPGMTPELVYAQRGNYFVAVHGANLYYLGDIIPIPLRALGGFISIGDVLLGFGLMLFLVAVITQKKKRNFVRN